MIENKFVVSFDLCSSSKILEDLSLTSNVDIMVEMLGSLHKNISEKVHDLKGEVYKFTGDGWILLFPDDIDGTEFVAFLVEVCEICNAALQSTIRPVLESTPERIGIAIGIDRGPLLRFKLTEKSEWEWIGRSINVACRLQNAIKDKDSNPVYKALVSKQVFQRLKLPLTNYPHVAVTRRLRNIRGGENFECVKTTLFRAPQKAIATLVKRRLWIPRSISKKPTT